MHVAFSATNPCHVLDLALALALADAGDEVTFLSGYPRAKLLRVSPAVERLRVLPESWRTLITYALYPRLPKRFQGFSPRLFAWQDAGFDRAVAGRLSRCFRPGAEAPMGHPHFLHGIPGQCLETFRVARRFGITTVLNHASGPARQQWELVRPEYERAGLAVPPPPEAVPGLEARLRAEVDLADWHLVASRIVARQLAESGVPAERIGVVPYGASPERFPRRAAAPKGEPFRVLFAGALAIRKGLWTVLKALELVPDPTWELHCYGLPLAETEGDFRAYNGQPRVFRHGPVSQKALAEALRGASVLVLPSVEEAFGLVVPQALQVGVPCLVSDRVGASDLLTSPQDGETLPFGDAQAWAAALRRWAATPTQVTGDFSWKRPAALAQAQHRAWLEEARA